MSEECIRVEILNVNNPSEFWIIEKANKTINTKAK